MFERMSKVKSVLTNPLYSGSIMMLAISLVLTATFYAYFNKSTAWFVGLDGNELKGMQVQIDVDSQMVISQDGIISEDTDFDTEITLSNSLSCATYSGDLSNPFVYYDPTTINPVTAQPTTTAMLNGVEGVHYHKVSTYLGVINHNIAMEKLTLNFSVKDGVADGYKRALSCLAVYNSTAYNLNLYNSTSVDIPIKSIAGNSPIKIDLYFYIDGELKDSSNNYIVTSTTLGQGDIDGTNLKLSFTAVNGQTS